MVPDPDKLRFLMQLEFLSETMPDTLQELFVQWCRLHNYELRPSPINKLIDEATGVWEERINEFAKDVDDLVFQRCQVG